MEHYVKDQFITSSSFNIYFFLFKEPIKVILYSYLILKKMNERITDS